MITARAIHQISGTLPQIAQIAGPSGGWALLGEIPFYLLAYQRPRACELSWRK